MIVLSYSQEYFDSIVELEAQIYPPELRAGREELAAELEKPNGKFLVIFRDGTLVGYIIAYLEEGHIYISDLNCVDKSALLWLLCGFFLTTKGVADFSAELVPESYHLLQREAARGRIILLEDEFLADYYAPGAHAHRVAFKVTEDKTAFSWKHRYLGNLSREKDMVGVNHFFDFIADEEWTREQYENAQPFVLRALNQHNLGIYRMLGPEVPVVVHAGRNFSSSTVEGYANKLEEVGYKRRTDYGRLNPGEFCVEDGRKIDKMDLYHYSNAKHNDLSSARNLLGRILKCGANYNYRSVTLFDKYGGRWHFSRPPYNTKISYRNHLNFKCEADRLAQRVSKEYMPSPYSMNRPEYKLKDLVGVVGLAAGAAILDGIIDRCPVPAPDNYYHDWNVVIDSLLANKRYMTKGSFIQVLSGSYNAARRKSDSINAVCTSAETLHRFYRRQHADVEAFVRTVRLKISQAMHKDRDLDEYSQQLSREATQLSEKAMKLTQKETQAAADYLVRMQRYNTWLDTNTLFSTLGKTFLKKVLGGKVSCVFAPQDFFLPDTEFCEAVLALLNTRTRAAKRVYGRLVQSGCLPMVLDKTLLPDKRDIVSAILARHNCSIDPGVNEHALFCAKVEPKCSPEFLVAGDASVCCMSFGSEKATTYARQEGFGLLNIYYKDRIIANSVLWIEDAYNCLVFDNVEVHPNYTRFNSYIRELYLIVADALIQQYSLDFAVQGAGYSDLNLGKVFPMGLTMTGRKPRNITGHFYSDARSAYVVCSEISMEEIQARKEISQQQIPVAA